MKKQILLSFIFLLLVGQAMAQNKTIDSLKIALKNATNDTTRCNILNALIEAESDDNIWPKYNDQLLAIVNKQINAKSVFKTIYLKHFAGATNNIGFFASQKGDVKKALEYYTKSLKVLMEIRDKNGIGGSLNNIGFIYYNQGDIIKALEYYTKSLKVYEEITYKEGIANSLNNIGLIYGDQGNITKALEYYTKSLKIKEEIGDKEGVGISLSSIGLIYSEQGDVSNALKYLNKSLRLYTEIGDKKKLAAANNNIGALYNDQGKLNKALEYYNRSRKIREEIGDKKGIAATFNNIGFVYFIWGDLTKALEYHTKSLEIREESKDKQGIAASLTSIGETYLKQKEYRKALIFTLRGMHLSQELGFPEKIERAAKQLNAIYKATNNYKAALENYELYVAMRDSTINQENKKASIKSLFKYEYEKKAAADSVKVAEEKKVVAVQLKQEKTQRLALYGGLVLVAIFAVFMFNRFRVTQKQKNIIELKEKETQQQNEIITIQKHLVEEKHKEITDSINYAERIQRSFLATKELLDENLKEYFVFFKPKDVVSGDFYWSAKLSNGNFALATADSTGHGVPGAIMSLLNVTSLERAIEHYTDPADILNHTRQTIIERLKKDGSEEGGKDGMDCSLLVFDFTNKQLLIAAANNPVWIIRSNPSNEGARQLAGGDVELIEIKPDKMPVGKSDKQDQSFTTHTVELQKGDTIYTLTDGFPDQFGGDKGKKFMSKKLKELLLANVHLPIAKQKELLDTTFKNWVGNLEQVDDVTVIGIKV
jgi:serine phosphatase RsbU (regulator of sigma subunit)/Tfp pilus assembly protein PilF